jgi:hypothetical protein
MGPKIAHNEAEIAKVLKKIGKASKAIQTKKSGYPTPCSRQDQICLQPKEGYPKRVNKENLLEEMLMV